MGTQVSITLWSESAIRGKQAIQAAFVEIERLNQLLSPYIESSELARVNQLAAISAQPISNEFASLIRRSLHYSKLSGGAFDITFASLGQHYDYRQKVTPSAALKRSLLSAINYQHIVLSHINPSINSPKVTRADVEARQHANNFTLKFLHPHVKIDLGGSAKGYAVDRAIEVIEQYGIKHAAVSAGGDSKLLGDKRGRPWVIGIKNPRANKTLSKQEQVAIQLPLENTAISTSGDYERYFIDPQTGQHVHHIINPRTGDSTKGVASVTILGRNGLDTDPLSTTVFILGVEKGLELMDKLPSFDCIIIDNQGVVHYSQGLQPGE